jgi:ABC-type arginine/histidine transport system permease subunit
MMLFVESLLDWYVISTKHKSVFKGTILLVQGFIFYTVLFAFAYELWSLEKFER